MNLGDVKREALYLMFANGEEDLSVVQWADLTDSQEYGAYLVAMPGCVNRCFSDMEARGVLPEKSVWLTEEDGEASGGRLRFRLSACCSDYGQAERLIWEENGISREENDLRAYWEGDVLSLPRSVGSRARYCLIYRPRLPRISSAWEDQAEIPLPDALAQWIPYWIKGELFREDEPNEAGEARNWYESAMNRAAWSASPRQGCVESVYALGEV